MTEESMSNNQEAMQEIVENNPKPVEVDLGRIIYSILYHNKTVSVPKELVINPVPEKTEIEIKYNNESEEFTFSLKDNG